VAELAQSLGAEIDVDFANGRGKVRIRQIMSDLKSDPVPYLPEFLSWGRIAWDNAGRRLTDFPDFVEYDVNEGTHTARVDDMIG
jgi:hypothetical protein